MVLSFQSHFAKSCCVICSELGITPVLFAIWAMDPIEFAAFKAGGGGIIPEDAPRPRVVGLGAPALDAFDFDRAMEEVDAELDKLVGRASEEEDPGACGVAEIDPDFDDFVCNCCL